MAAAVLWFGAAGGAHVALLAGCAWPRRRRLALPPSSPALVGGALGDDPRPRRAPRRPSHAAGAGGARPLACRRGPQPRRLPRRSQALDRWSPALLVGLPRGWMVFAIGALAPAFVTGSPGRQGSPSASAASCSRHWRCAVLSRGLSQLSGAVVAWSRPGRCSRRRRNVRWPGHCRRRAEPRRAAAAAASRSAT